MRLKNPVRSRSLDLLSGILMFLIILVSMAGCSWMASMVGPPESTPEMDLLEPCVRYRLDDYDNVIIEMGFRNDGDRSIREMDNLNGRWQLIGPQGNLRAEGEHSNFIGVSAGESSYLFSYESRLASGSYRLVWGADGIGTLVSDFTIERNDSGSSLQWTRQEVLESFASQYVSPEDLSPAEKTVKIPGAGVVFQLPVAWNRMESLDAWMAPIDELVYLGFEHSRVDPPEEVEALLFPSPLAEYDQAVVVGVDELELAAGSARRYQLEVMTSGSEGAPIGYEAHVVLQKQRGDGRVVYDLYLGSTNIQSLKANTIILERAAASLHIEDLVLGSY